MLFEQKIAHHFSAFEHHAELAANELSWGHWNFIFERIGLVHLDYHVQGAVLEMYHEL